MPFNHRLTHEASPEISATLMIFEIVLGDQQPKEIRVAGNGAIKLGGRSTGVESLLTAGALKD